MINKIRVNGSSIFPWAIALSFSFSTFVLAQSESGSKRTYDDVQKVLRDIASTNSATAKLVEVGPSDSGKTIEALQIGNGPVNQLVVATHHGNEYGSTEVALAFAKDIAEHPLDGKTIYVLPVLNIDGYNRKNRTERANGVPRDPNRDYPGPCATEGPFKLKSTKSLADFIAAKNIIASATMHTYWKAVLYPWGNSATSYSTLYDNLFIKLAQAATAVSNYTIGFSGEVIYPADGTFEDYAYWQHGIWSLLFEIGESHSPNANDVDKLKRDNVPGLRRMMESAQTARADNHAFTAGCRRASFDPHIE